MDNDVWRIFSLERLTGMIEGRAPAFAEFLRSASLSCAIYRLPAGAKDMQAPHLEDEVYFVVNGRAWLQVGEEKREIRAGDILYVQATARHSFFDIDEDLTLIAVFGPARPR
ncbi:MAG TPA: cupin domain-containing protein [Burkholderiales bacterium]|nr:cupin domain-containing protein [Burkholderiales bacterium]